MIEVMEMPLTRIEAENFTVFENSLDSLAEARERDMSDSFVLSGTGAKFSITFDLVWKVMKDILVQYYAITGFPFSGVRFLDSRGGNAL